MDKYVQPPLSGLVCDLSSLNLHGSSIPKKIKKKSNISYEFHCKMSKCLELIVLFTTLCLMFDKLETKTAAQQQQLRVASTGS